MAWSAEQLANARAIIAIGQSMGMSSRDIQIGLMTAITESQLQNLSWGDGSSTGLFQQTDAWGGTDAQHQNITWATTSFFTALRNLGSSRMSMSLGEAAQAVQRSAYPDRYQTHLAEAGALLGLKGQLPTGGAGGHIDLGDSASGGLGALGAPTGTTPQAAPGPIGLESTVPQADTGPTAIAAPQTQSINALGLTDGAPSPLGLGGSEAAAAFMPTIPNMGAPGDPVSGLQGSASGAGGDWRSKVTSIARGLAGIPYVWGGTTTQGFDCSGFVQYVYKQMGVNLPRISYQQANYGQHIALADLKPGDLVAWDLSSRNPGADHIAIFLGNGLIMEAPRPGMSVQISSIYDQAQAWGVRMFV